MELIKEEEMTTSSYCVNCLCKSKDRNILYYKLQSEHLKIIFKVDALALCFVCKKHVQNAECLIEKILNNQILVNLHNFSDQTIDVMVQPYFNIAVLDTIELSGIDVQTDEATIVYKYGVYNECIVKNEMKCEFEDYLRNDNDFIDIKVDIKNELSDIAECDTDINEIKIQKKTVKKKKGINKGRKRKAAVVTNGMEETNCQINNDVNSINVMDLFKELETKEALEKSKLKKSIERTSIQKFYINSEQLMQERNIKANEKTYINCVYKCTDCVKGFAYKATYQKHMELHSKDKGNYVCNVCKQRMDTDEKLFQHKKLHQIRYKCLICGITQKTCMRDHYNSYHSKVAVLYKCKSCPRTFTDRYYLRKHVTYRHKDRRVTCAHCMKTYANKDVLKNHIQLRHPTVFPPAELKKTIVCNECGKAFKSPSQLKAHSLKHSSEKKFYCVECDKSFKSENTLKQHLKLTARHVNPSELQYLCTQCDRRFGIKRDLERHMNRIHLNIRPYKCDLCEKAFNNSWCVKKHKKISHEGYKRPYIFPCTMCDKIFDQKSILKSHIRTHTGERPFQCTICPAKFTQSSSLGTHTKLVHLKQTRTGKPKTLK
ncbi:gastrula zinc finger protein XlCGF26.1 [Papilio machaon]|uniref:gastrula zinc finger protein XlCGF26.1 n=1 Tax=Papilio machaon TaxID=76193 RepID=UPI001E6643D2|nr:gastrula zinc finger protein XlCGF26.1 [Papilio machaon]